MDRKNFVKIVGLATASLLFSYTLKNPFKEAGFELDVYAIEKAIMTKSIIDEQTPIELVKIYDNFMNNSSLNTTIQPIKKRLMDLTLEKVKSFSKKMVSYKKSELAKKEMDNIYTNIDLIKQNYNIQGLDHNLQNDLASAQIILSKINSLQRNSENKKIFYDLYFTLEKISPDILFIKKASEDANIPLEDIIALVAIESNGREFVVSNSGAINRFQINPRQLKYIYNNVTSLGNSLSEYIKENTSREKFLVDLVQDSKLNIATGINYFAYLKENTRAEWENVVGYCYGPNGILRLPNKVKDALYKLSKGEISKKKIRYHAISYYKKFLETRNAFKEIKNSVS